MMFFHYFALTFASNLVLFVQLRNMPITIDIIYTSSMARNKATSTPTDGRWTLYKDTPALTEKSVVPEVVKRVYRKLS